HSSARPGGTPRAARRDALPRAANAAHVAAHGGRAPGARPRAAPGAAEGSRGRRACRRRAARGRGTAASRRLPLARDVDRARARALPRAGGRAPVAPRALGVRATAASALRAGGRGAGLLPAPPQDAVLIMGDATKLTWALSNLVANALRYTPRAGRITVDVSA